jgi:hypothetical protein
MQARQLTKYISSDCSAVNFFSFCPDPLVVFENGWCLMETASVGFIALEKSKDISFSNMAGNGLI